VNKAQENAMLLVLYGSRSGRFTLSDVAVEFGLSKPFLEQVARRLRIAGIMKSFQGAAGGYEVVGSPTGMEVLEAMGYKSVPYAHLTLSKHPEVRALGNLMRNLRAMHYAVLDRKVENLNHELAANELKAMSRATSVN
jgi:DNA-binding IscR family transcriptional regulator